MIDEDSFRRGFRRLASGVCCITTRWRDRPHGFLATSVSSLSGQPPALIVCVSRDVSSHESFRDAGVLCVNVLAESEKSVAVLFSDKSRRDLRFADRSWTAMRTGAPVFGGALVAFDCEIDTTIPYATHTIFICRIVDALIGAAVDAAPLLYFDGSFRELARAER
jgi:flavin reductase